MLSENGLTKGHGYARVLCSFAASTPVTRCRTPATTGGIARHLAPEIVEMGASVKTPVDAAAP